MEVQTFNKLSKFEIITNKRIIDAVINTIYDHLNVSMFGYKMIDANNCLPSLVMYFLLILSTIPSFSLIT